MRAGDIPTLRSDLRTSFGRLAFSELTSPLSFQADTAVDVSIMRQAVNDRTKRWALNVFINGSATNLQALCRELTKSSRHRPRRSASDNSSSRVEVTPNIADAASRNIIGIGCWRIMTVDVQDRRRRESQSEGPLPNVPCST